MSRIRIDIPESLHVAAGDLARECAEKISAMAGPEWLKARAARGDRARFEEALSRVADTEPEERDRK